MDQTEQLASAEGQQSENFPVSGKATSGKPTIGEQDSVKTRIRNPRSLWFEFFLLLFTLNTYTCFWMFGRARDIKQASNNDFTPWLWFLAPLNSLVQLFAFPIMFKELRNLEPETSSNWLSYGWVWIALLWIAGMVLNLMDFVGLPEWVFPVTSIVITCLFLILHARFNRWKATLQEVDFHGKENGYQWYEWLSLLLCAPIAAGIVYVLAIEPVFINKLEAFDDGHVITNEEYNYTLTLNGEGWNKVEVGTYSDGTALLELDGPLLTEYFLVFDWGVGYSLNQATQDRYERSLQEVNSDKCSEVRVLSKKEDSVISAIQCNGSGFGEKVSVISTFIESQGRVIELYGYVSDTHLPYKNAVELMQSTSRSFSPL